MTKADIDQAIDDERRKTSTTFINTSEKTRYENLVLRDISRQVDLDAQETSTDFSHSPASGTSASYATSTFTGLKDRKAFITFASTSATIDIIPHVRPEEFDLLARNSVDCWTVDGLNVKINYTGNTGDTLRARYYTNYVAQTSGASLSASLTASTDEPLLDPEYQEAVIQGALMKVFKKEESWDDYKEAKQRYYEILTDIGRNNETRRSMIFDRMTVEE